MILTKVGKLKVGDLFYYKSWKYGDELFELKGVKMNVAAVYCFFGSRVGSHLYLNTEEQARKIETS